MRSLWTQLDAVYADRPLDRLRSHAMAGAYLIGMLVAVIMAVHDVSQSAELLALHLLNEVAMFSLLAAGLALLLRGRVAPAGQIMVPITLVFSVATLTDAWGDNPAGFYDGWARWYPVYIVAAMLFARPVTAVLITAWSIAWTVGYYLLFCRTLPEAERMRAFGEVIEVSAVDLLIGGLAVGGMVMVQGAMARAHAELERNRVLTDGLEQRVADRTRDVERALAERQAILASLTDGLVVLGPDLSTIAIVNPALRRMLGLEEVAMLGAPAEDFLPESLLSVMEASGEGGSAGPRVVSWPDGSLVEVSATWVRHQSTLVGVVAVARDVTLQQEVDRMKTEFISMASHELRTPMTSILGFAKLVGTKLERHVFPVVPADEASATRAVQAVRANLDIIVQEGERLTALLNDVLDISKMESGAVALARDPVDVSGVVRQAASALDSLFQEEGPTLSVEVEDDLPAILGDRQRLVQVVVNFLSNAHKFTAEGAIVAGARRVGDGVEVWVQDSGTGIAPADQERIFDRFTQAGDPLTGKPRGTGLGLAICAQIIARHDARIALQSTPGEGSRFSFVLPPAPG